MLDVFYQQLAINYFVTIRVDVFLTRICHGFWFIFSLLIMTKALTALNRVCNYVFHLKPKLMARDRPDTKASTGQSLFS